MGRGVQPTAPAEGIRWKKILEMGKPPCELPAHMHGGEDDEVFHMHTLPAHQQSHHCAAPSKAPRAGASERSERGRQRGALDISRIMPPVEVKGSFLRRKRWERRSTSAKFLAPLATEMENGFRRPVRPARCAWTLGQSVGVMHDGGSRPAGYSGIERCGSIWVCPHCSAVIRAGRAREIEQAVKYHQERGGTVLFFTGTARHHQADTLAVTMDAILEAWRKLTAGRPWKRIKEKYQVSGYIRSIEVTYGGNGWHPHAHCLLFLDADISPDQLEELRPTLYELWATCVEKAGGKRPTEKGLDLQRLDTDGKLLARYLSKVQDEKKQGWSAGAEMTRSDVKSGRNGSITPFQLLDDHPGYDEQTRARLWREYYLVSKGRRAITWSRGLKERCCIGEVTDADILDAAESTVLVWQTSARAYRQVLRSEPVLLAVALELAEREKWAQLAEIFPRDDVPPDQWE